MCSSNDGSLLKPTAAATCLHVQYLTLTLTLTLTLILTLTWTPTCTQITSVE